MPRRPCRRRTSLSLLVALALSACGGGDSTAPVPPPAPPPAPPPPPPPPPAPVASVTVAPPAGPLTVGTSTTLTATLRDAGGTTLTGRIITWSTSNQTVASVSQGGVVTGVSAGGPVTISALSEGVTGTAQVTVVPRSLDAIVDSVRQAHGLPAMAAAVVTRSGLLALGVGGTRRATGGPAVTADDKWHIGSNLKSMTSTLAALAVGEGAISWQTTVTQAFPELAGQIRAEYADVTLRDLLSMASGIPRNPPQYIGATAVAQREWAIGWALSQVPVVPKGTYHYSNIAYVVAGAMIERALGGVYEDLLVARVGVPVGALHIGWGPQAAAGASDQPVGHSRVGGAWVACEGCDFQPGISSAGHAHMPMGDWARIVVELMRADAGSSTLLSQSVIAPVFTGVTPLLPGTDSYALGWNMTTRSWGGRTAYHTGSNQANSSAVWIGLGTNVAFLVSTNAWDETLTGAALNGLVGRLITWHQSGQ
jgi:CubicO group peptidase (beta-lactamase class C family)